jgi:hypothetical protein
MLFAISEPRLNEKKKASTELYNSAWRLLIEISQAVSFILNAFAQSLDSGRITFRLDYIEDLLKFQKEMCSIVNTTI